MSDTNKFHDALKAAGLEYSAMSCDGVNLFGDRKSIDKALEWQHYAEQRDTFQAKAVLWKQRWEAERAKATVSSGERG